MQNQAQPTKEQLTYGGCRAVDERDVYSLVRARKECLHTAELVMRHMIAPKVRDINDFFLAIENVESQPTKVDDPLEFTCQVRLGLVDVDGWRYAKIVWLDKPEPPQDWLDRRKESAGGYKAAEQTLAEEIRKETKRHSLDDWSEKSQGRAAEFAGFLQNARALLRRYPELVTVERFPEPFRLALERAVGVTDPDSEVADYGDLHLIKEELLVCQDHKVTAAATCGSFKDQRKHKPSRKEAAGNTEAPTAKHSKGQKKTKKGSRKG